MTLALPPGDRVTLTGVPSGIYTVAVPSANAHGQSAPSSAVTITVPGPCVEPPAPVSDPFIALTGRTVSVDWLPGPSGAAPTMYVLQVTGASAGRLETTERALASTLPPGSYAISVAAANPCGTSAGSPWQAVLVP